MAERKNFLLGYGERLTAKIRAPGGGGPKSHPYTFREAQARLKPKLENLVQEIIGLPDLACPNEQVVAVLTLHPSYMANRTFLKNFLALWDCGMSVAADDPFPPKSGERSGIKM